MGNRHCGDIAVVAAIIRLVDEAVDAAKVGSWCVCKRAITVQGYCTVRGGIDQNSLERVTFSIGIVTQHTGRGYRESGPVQRISVIGCHGWIVRRGDCDRHRGGIIAARCPIIDRVEEGFGAEKVSRRGIIDARAAHYRDRAASRTWTGHCDC